MQITFGDEVCRGMVPKANLSEVLTTTQVYRRSTADESNMATAADQLEVVALGCLLGNYLVALVCYTVNGDKGASERSAGLDLFLFIFTLVFTLAPFAAAMKLHKIETARISARGTKTGEKEFDTPYENPVGSTG